MKRLLAVFLKAENVRKATNLWRVRTFNALEAHDAVLLTNVDDIDTATLFCTNPRGVEVMEPSSGSHHGMDTRLP